MAMHFDPAEATRELEGQGFEHRQALAIVNLIRDRVFAHVEAGRGEDADAAVAAITQTERSILAKIEAVHVEMKAELQAEIGGVKTEVAAVEGRLRGEIGEIRSEMRDLRHELQLTVRDAADRAGERAEAAASRTNMFIGLASAFLGLMIAASAVLPAVVALFK